MNNKFWDRLIFRGISEESIKAIEDMDKRVCSYGANELIIEEGTEIKDFCIIVDGVIKATEYTESGKELNSSYFFEGDAFPFYLVYGGRKKYFFNTYTLKKSKVVWLPVEKLLPIIEKDEVFLHNILRFVAEYTCYSKLILRGVQYRKVIERLAFWIDHFSDDNGRIAIPNSQEVLADILHVNRSSLNQEIMKLHNMGIIELEGKIIKILDPEHLKNLL